MANKQGNDENGVLPNEPTVYQPFNPEEGLHFYRLLQLFPEYHPIGIARLFKMCDKDFIRTIDNVLYVKRYKRFLEARNQELENENDEGFSNTASIDNITQSDNAVSAEDQNHSPESITSEGTSMASIFSAELYNNFHNESPPVNELNEFRFESDENFAIFCNNMLYNNN